MDEEQVIIPITTTTTGTIRCLEYSGLISEMPQEAKDALKLRRPEAYAMIFGN